MIERRSAIPRLQLAGAVLVLTVAALLLCYNLGNWPVTWYDEGINLQIARNLAETGRYGILSSDGFRAFGPWASTGATVSIPVALAFRALGTGLLQARVVMAAYALLAVLSMYLLAIRLFDVRTAVVSTLLLISVGAASGDISASFVGLGRMVMGEMPALAFLLAGALLWSSGLDSGRGIHLAGAGLLWGLAIVTKQQFVLIAAGLGLTWALQAVLRRRAAVREVAMPLMVSLACASVWLVWEYYGSGSAQQAEMAGRIGTQLFVLAPRLIVKAARVLLSQREIVWGLPALLYGLYLALTEQRSSRGLLLLFLVVTCLFWLAWFVLGSVGWGRYAFAPIAIMALFTGKLLLDLLEQFGWPSRSGDADATAGAMRRVVMLLAVALMIFGSLQSVGRDMIMSREDTPAAFAQFLDRSLAPGTAIECFEPEIVFFSRTGFRFHQPPFWVESLAIRHTQRGVPYPDGSYDFREQGVAYVVSGPFSKATGIYDQGLQSPRVSLVKSVGAYDLYQVKHLEGN